MTQAEAMAHAEAQLLREGILVATGSRGDMLEWCIEYKVQEGTAGMTDSELAFYILNAVVRPPAEKKEKKKGIR